jgi:cell division protein FtsL
MPLFVLGSLSLCLLFFLVMACVNLIGMEHKIIEAVHLAEAKVMKLYEGN